MTEVLRLNYLDIILLAAYAGEFVAIVFAVRIIVQIHRHERRRRNEE